MTKAKKKNKDDISSNQKLEEVIRQKKIESDALKKLMLSLEKLESSNNKNI
jgi:hypothetical protein